MYGCNTQKNFACPELKFLRGNMRAGFATLFPHGFATLSKQWQTRGGDENYSCAATATSVDSNNGKPVETLGMAKKPLRHLESERGRNNPPPSEKKKKKKGEKKRRSSNDPRRGNKRIQQRRSQGFYRKNPLSILIEK
jgi:hypothetical protein